jgi:hypothetical protein
VAAARSPGFVCNCNCIVSVLKVLHRKNARRATAHAEPQRWTTHRARPTPARTTKASLAVSSRLVGSACALLSTHRRQRAGGASSQWRHASTNKSSQRWSRHHGSWQCWWRSWCCWQRSWQCSAQGWHWLSPARCFSAAWQDRLYRPWAVSHPQREPNSKNVAACSVAPEAQLP